jgi:hypothetical protein
VKRFEIVHIGIAVEKSTEIAKYIMKLNIKFSAEDEEKGVAFITDCNDKVTLELGKL